MAEYIIELPDKLPLKEAPPLQYARKLVRCKDCRRNMICEITLDKPPNWYCADGVKKD